MKLTITILDYRNRPIELGPSDQERLITAIRQMIEGSVEGNDLREIARSNLGAIIEYRPDVRPEDLFGKR